MTLAKKDIQPFIFNWPGQYEKVCKIEEELNKIFDDVIVINSDDDNTNDGWINIGNDAYFSDQFRKALELYSRDKKVLFHVQGDTSYDKWEDLVDDSLKYFDEYEWGIYAPDIANIWYTSEYVDVNSVASSHDNIKMCACTDETVWFIHSDVIKDFDNRNLLDAFQTNKMGWGWDLVMCSLSFIMSRPVIRDYNHRIEHKMGTNYNKEVAAREMMQLRARLENEIKQCIDYIKTSKENISRYFV